MKITWRGEWPHALLLAGQFALAALTWSSAPDRLPAHWGFDGQVDRYAGRFEALLLPPLVSLAVYLVLIVLPRFDPGRANYPTFAGAYGTMRLAVTAAMTAIYLLAQLAAHGRIGIVLRAAPLVAGALCVVVGSVMGKLRPNWFVGIRTPWTLSSKQSWTRTHRAAGWVLIGLGLLVPIASMTGPARAPWWIGLAAAAGLIGLVAYSYVVWRDDPEKVPPAGTLPATDPDPRGGPRG